MIVRRPLGPSCIALLAVTAGAAAQRVDSAATANAPPSWTVSATVYGYVVPSGTSYLMPILVADRGSLHLEGRYNYESVGSASLFAGWAFTGGDHVHIAATPMLGFVFGDLRGAAPGFEFTLDVSRFELYTEAEYVLDFAGRSGDYLYLWSDATYALSPAWHAGLAGQRLRSSQTGRTIDSGPIVVWQPGDWSASATVYDPFTANVYYAVSVGLSF